MKKFALRDILTVTTGRLLTKPKSSNDNGISDLYEILGYMTGEMPFTHSLPRFSEECRPLLLETYPELNMVDVNLLDLMKKNNPGDFVDKWLEQCISEHGLKEQYGVPKLERSAHISLDPISELEALLGK